MCAAWVGEFGDAYVRDTELEGGYLAVSVEHLTSMLRAAAASAELPLAGPAGDAMPPNFANHVEAMCSALTAAADMTIEKRAAGTPDAQVAYIAHYRAMLEGIAPGGLAIAPGTYAVRAQPAGRPQAPAGR
jgi:hypothetical protein